VGATISRTAGGFSERTTVKYSDRGVWYVYIAAARPASRIMGAPKGWCCRRGFASAGLGGVSQMGMFVRWGFWSDYF